MSSPRELSVDLGAGDFGAFFRAIHGYLPFPWQQRLVDLLAAGDAWPDVLDLPTGSGKTAALDAAVFHMALRSDSPARTALRIALVVDRRLVVDDAHERATRIASYLADPTRAEEAQRPVLAEVARRLQLLAGAGQPALVVGRLRGGAPLESDWARTPTQPTILCSTVDQVGSRLLFRGYGVSDRMKPVHAGLLGMHSLILLDEAHLSEPFRQTLHAVQKVGGAKVRTVLLSATSGAKPKRPFGLTEDDRTCRDLQDRLQAPKPAKLHVVHGSPGDDFVRVARGIAESLQKSELAAPAVGVVVNRVALAREVFEQLRSLENETGADAVLLIGRSRDVGRDQIIKKLVPFRTGEARESITNPLFVVATQCLEVGVDLDLDGLVTQAASLDALRQRFGRLNRAGRRNVTAAGAILVGAGDVTANSDDAIYGDRIAKTWQVLHRIARDDVVDFGIEALERSLQELKADMAALAAPRDRAPVMMPAYMDLWSQTSPPPSADPDVGLFLHGVERTSAGVSLVWRSDITTADFQAGCDLAPILELVPPRVPEMIEVPVWSARAWLGRSGNQEQLANISDAVERDSGPVAAKTREGNRPAFRWAGADDSRTGWVLPDELRPGDVLVLPADQGGCDAFGWAPASDERVTDVADEAARPFQERRHVVRISRDVVLAGQWRRLSEILADDGAAGDELVDRLLGALPVESSSMSGGGSEEIPTTRAVRAPLEALRYAKGRKSISVHTPYRGGRTGGVVLLAQHGVQPPGAIETGRADNRPATEDDVLSRAARKPVSIDEHTRHVVTNVDRFVQVLWGRDEPVARDLELAALLHDAGKADARFQDLLSGGDAWNRADGPAMAKSGQQSPKGAWERAGLPTGWRHEALSVRMARSHPRFAEANDPALVLWLIGTHHGLGRPFFSFADSYQGGAGHNGVYACLGVEYWRLVGGPGPQSMAFDLDGADWGAMYEELKQRYGIWGLAHLEAVLRLADHRASELERRDV